MAKGGKTKDPSHVEAFLRALGFGLMSADDCRQTWNWFTVEGEGNNSRGTSKAKCAGKWRDGVKLSGTQGGHLWRVNGRPPSSFLDDYLK